MDPKRALCVFLGLAMVFALSIQMIYAEEEGGVGLSLAQTQAVVNGRHLLGIDCDSACGTRCAKARNRCKRFCGMCCKECQCVPSGTYGNKDECPCYRDKKNKKGGDKCP